MISKYLLQESAKYGEYAVSTGGLGGCITSMMELVEAGYWVKVREENQWTAPFDVYAITPAGLAYLYQDAPMVDQPQPIDETTIEGEVSFYADGKPQDGTIVAGTDKYGYTVRSVNGKVYDEIQRGDIEPRLGDEIDDLPFSDLGEPDESTSFEQFVLNGGQGEWSMDDEDTKELPAITVDAPKPEYDYFEYLTRHIGGDVNERTLIIKRTPRNPNRPTLADAIRLPLSKLIDAALMSSKPTERIDALNALRTYEWSTVPSWVMEIELSDLLQAFDSAMVERRKAKVKVLYGTEVTPQDVKALIRTRSFCNLVSDCMTIVSQVYQARINHLVKVAYDS